MACRRPCGSRAGFESHSASEHLQAIYLGETLFYRDVAARLDLGPPRCYAAWLDHATGQSYLLLEDLLALHAEFGHATRPITPAQAARVLEVRARLHARFWHSHELDAVSWLQGGGRHTAYTIHWSVCLPEWQPEAVCLANAERACAAIVDHQSFEAW